MVNLVWGWGLKIFKLFGGGMTGVEMTGNRRVFWWYGNEGKYDWCEYG